LSSSCSRELDRDHDLGPDLDRRLTKYTALNPKLLRLLGADRFLESPIRAIEGGTHPSSLEGGSA
jgi:hypothetical protein